MIANFIDINSIFFHECLIIKMSLSKCNSDYVPFSQLPPKRPLQQRLELVFQLLQALLHFGFGGFGLLHDFGKLGLEVDRWNRNYNIFHKHNIDNIIIAIYN